MLTVREPSGNRRRIAGTEGSLSRRVVEVASPENDDGSNSDATINFLWHVLHTRARQEKAIARALDAAGIENYLPMQKRVGYRSRRKCVIEEPVFASYLFMQGPIEATYFAVATKRVANVIKVADQDQFVMEMKQLRRAISNGAELSPYSYLEVGRNVRVTAGPFQGVEGLVEERRRPDRLILQVAALGRATSLEIDAGLLEPAD